MPGRVMGLAAFLDNTHDHLLVSELRPINKMARRKGFEPLTPRFVV